MFLFSPILLMFLFLLFVFHCHPHPFLLSRLHSFPRQHSFFPLNLSWTPVSLLFFISSPPLLVHFHRSSLCLAPPPHSLLFFHFICFSMFYFSSSFVWIPFCPFMFFTIWFHHLLSSNFSFFSPIITLLSSFNFLLFSSPLLSCLLLSSPSVCSCLSCGAQSEGDLLSRLMRMWDDSLSFTTSE